VDIDARNRTAQFTWHNIETEYYMKTIRIKNEGKPQPKSWYEQQLNEELTKLDNETTKKIILSVIFSGTYTKDSPRIEPNSTRAFIQQQLAKKLFFLGAVSMKDLAYEERKAVDIQSIRALKMDEDQILEFLEKSGADHDLAGRIVTLYKQVDDAYANPVNLTQKKKDLKGDVETILLDIIEKEVRGYYTNKVTDKDLARVVIEPGQVMKSTVKSQKRASKPVKGSPQPRPVKRRK
jgi:hypothetical protein